MRKKYHLGDQPIPSRFRIYEERLEVLGVQRRRADALAFCHGRGQSLAFVLEPSNPHDANAIRIDGAWKGWLFSKQKQLGYVPREIAARLAETGLAATVRPRLLKTYAGTDGYVEIEYQIIGPADQLRDYRPPSGARDVAKSAVEDGDSETAIATLLQMIAATEADAKANNWGVAPRPYSDLAVLYRKLKRHDDEVAILERFEAQPKAPGVMPAKLAERLIRAREIRSAKARK